MKKAGHIISDVKKKSIAYKNGILKGDVLLKINGEEIIDIFDYEYMVQDELITLTLQREDEEYEVVINKYEDEDIGLIFENGLMDEYRSCHNKCIFCFIDQMPKGMRETLYFKDDDSRLSFLQGNYITLTNLSENDVDRICKYHLSPINISFQTTNRELRCKMLNNRFAGDALDKIKYFVDANITMNGQIVLCKGVNDGAELEKSLNDLLLYAPLLESVSVVPVGLTKYRDGLYPLEPFTKEDALEVISLIEKVQAVAMDKHGIHFVHASDEWYILAEKELPPEESYDGYLQLENGVGMIRLLINEFELAMKELLSSPKKLKQLKKKKDFVSVATGKLAYPYINKMVKALNEITGYERIQIYEIRNDFFGELITVSGLLTGRDICNQLQDKKLGSTLFLPQNVLRSEEDVFLDDMRVAEMESTLHVKVDIVKSSGWDFVNTLLMLK